jgi:hypothetical protein
MKLQHLLIWTWILSFAQGEPGAIDDLCAKCGAPFTECLVDFGCVSAPSDVSNYLFGGFLIQAQDLKDEVLSKIYNILGMMLQLLPLFGRWGNFTLYNILAVTSKLYYFYYFMGDEAYLFFTIYDVLAVT